MLVIKNKKDIEIMRESCRIASQALKLAGKAVRPGVTTQYIDKIIYEYITSKGGTPSFLGYGSFPASSCISVNDEVIHGIPSSRIILEGDIVSVDVGVLYKGFHGDNAATFPVGQISDEAKRLIETTKKCLELGIEKAVVGLRLGDVASTIQNYVESQRFSVVRDYVGHGVGRNLHEEPSVPNYGTAGRGLRMVEGMTIAIEPMVNFGKHKVRTLENDWTVITEDGHLSAHFEHTIAITENGPIILTLP